jgi:Tfp pilus assembly protein PilF
VLDTRQTFEYILDTMLTRLPRRARVVVLILSSFSCFAQASASSKDVWIEVRSPNFTVISNAGTKQARHIANQFEQFRGIIRDIFPRLRVDSGKRLVIFALRNEESIRMLLPAYWEVKGNKHPAGIYVRGLERDFIALRTDTQEENPYYVVYHEYTHAILDLNFRWLPIWLDEGIAEFFGNSTIYDDHVEIGKVSPYQVEILQKNRLIPVDDLLQVDSKSPYYSEDNRATVFYAESCAIVHYLLLDSEARDQHLLQTFLDSWEAGGNQVDIARKAFGNLNTFTQAMQNYARQHRFYVADVKVSVHDDPKDYSSRELSPAEISALHGELYLYTNRPNEARTALDKALRADPNSPLVHEGLGLLAFRQQEFGVAEAEFARAVELNSTSYIAYFFSARAQMGLAKPDSDDGAREIADLEKAIRLNPQFAPAYATLASLYSLNPITYIEAIEAGHKAIQLEPGNLSLAVSFGFALVNMGKTTEARTLATQIEAAARTPSDREMLEKLNDRVAKGDEFAKRTAENSSSVAKTRQGQQIQGQSASVGETTASAPAETLAKPAQTVTPDMTPHSLPDPELQNHLFYAVVQPGATPKAESSSLKINLKQENGAVFRGAATVRVMPDEGYELTGARGDVAGEYVFMDVGPGRYVIEISAPGYLAVQTKTEIEGGRRQRILFAVMKPRVLAKTEEKMVQPEVLRETNGEMGASTNVPGAKAKAVTAAPKERDYWSPHELEEVVPPVDTSVACLGVEVLESTGQRMKEFVGTLEKFTATETVEHYAIDPSGSRKGPQTRKFAYVAAVTLVNDNVFNIEEFRDGSIDPDQFPAHLATVGLSAIDLVLHPVLAGDFEFHCEGLGQWKGREVWQVHFAQRKDKPVRIRSYRVNGMVYPVFLEGRVWIHPGNNEVIHLESELAAPVPRIELTLEHLTIDYGPVKFQSTGEQIWLPQVAELYVERHRNRYYRRHTFTDFKLFNVETTQSLQPPTGSYTITNISDSDVTGDLSVVPSREGMAKALTLRVTVPAHRSVVKVVGPGKDVDLAPESVGSATFAHNGTNWSVKVDAHLLQATTVDVVPGGTVVQKP